MDKSSTKEITVFVSAYAINPFKGSEDGMGWNFVLQIAQNVNVIAVTRKNNRPHIEKFQAENQEFSDLYSRIDFQYYDWPQWLLFWKKGPVLSLIYYYFWQLSLALSFLKLRKNVDIVHNLNFHNDWTPSFLWIWRKPFVWGPVGHHPLIPKKFLRPFYPIKTYIMDRFLWTLKNVFWIADPFLKITKYSASHILCMHEEAAQKLNLKSKYSIMPSVASEEVEEPIKSELFTVLSAGRFVGLKGFDITIHAFHGFISQLSPEDQLKTKLVLVGSGPEKNNLIQLANSLGIEGNMEIVEWIPREDLMQLYRTASVFLFPSHEGAGMVVSEAMSYCLPVLCWDNCGPGRFVHPNSELKVAYNPESDWKKSFSNKLLKLHSNREFRITEQQLARSRFENNFKWNNRAGELYQVYKNVLNHVASVEMESQSELHLFAGK